MISIWQMLSGLSIVILSLLVKSIGNKLSKQARLAALALSTDNFFSVCAHVPMVQALIFIVLFSSFQLQAVDPRACLLHVLLREEAIG